MSWVRDQPERAIRSFEEVPHSGKFVRFKSHDGLDMSGFLTYAQTDSVKGTVILLHGIRSYKEHFRLLSMELSQQGFHSIALDLRAHGASAGVHCTFGVKQKEDIFSLVNKLTKEGYSNIGVWGQSLGGAVALQALAHDKRLRFGIIESSFSDFRETTHDYSKYHLGFNVPPFTNFIVTRAGQLAGFDPDHASPRASCKRITQPILMVHGGSDRRIQIHYARENFNNLISKRKEFLTIPHAGHLNIWEIGGDTYLKKAFDFIASPND